MYGTIQLRKSFEDGRVNTSHRLIHALTFLAPSKREYYCSRTQQLLHKQTTLRLKKPAFCLGSHQL